MGELFFSHELTSIIWLVLLFLLVLRAWYFSKPVAGLALCHWFSQAINHFFGEFFVSQNLDFASPDRNAAKIGYQISAWAVSGLIMAFFTVFILDNFIHKKNVSSQSVDLNVRIGFVAMVYGLICYFGLNNILSFIPSITSVMSGGLAMAAAGMSWSFLGIYKKDGSFRGIMFASLMFLFPALTVLLGGFMGYGISAVFSVSGVVMVTFKPRWVIAVIAPVLLYLGLSVYPSYMISRSEIRDKVWAGADYQERFDVTVGSISQNWQWFDPNDEGQMALLNGRLNQNILIGYSQEYISAGKVELAGGETLWDGLLALIPRAIWPNKPLTAGSGNLVGRFTGIKFGDSTSVGIGCLMEFYVNFGYIGVFFGYYIVGFVIYSLDSKAGGAISNMDPGMFFICFVPVQALMIALGSFIEWGPAFVGGGVLVWFFNRYVKPPEPVKWRSATGNFGFERGREVKGNPVGIIMNLGEPVVDSSPLPAINTKSFQ